MPYAMITVPVSSMHTSYLVQFSLLTSYVQRHMLMIGKFMLARVCQVSADEAESSNGRYKLHRKEYGYL